MRIVVLLLVLLSSCGGDPPCGSSTCTGCCLDGVCKVGTAREACGTNGAACSACNDFQTCAVVPGTTGGGAVCKQNCDNTTCSSGCCKAGACTGGGTSSACGSGGNACIDCGANASCSSGTCTPQYALTIVYNFKPSGGACQECRTTRLFDSTRADSLKTTYTNAGCSVTPQASDSATIACPCGGTCGTCTMPPGCSATACAWNPPP